MINIPAVENLRKHQQQLDAYGVMVGVSRQALDEALEHITDLQSRLAAAEVVIDRLRGQLNNCVMHLEGAKRRSPHTGEKLSACIESANRALYETLVSEAIDKARGEGDG